jgi:DNA invertase Pin-like site-specific DNA recombinase
MTARTRSSGTRKGRHAGRRTAVQAFGYASVPGGAALDGAEMEAQRVGIESACGQLGLELVSLVRDHEPNGAGDRPGLRSALERIEAGEASCLVVSDLERLSRQVGELATVLDRLERHKARLIALDVGLDTATPSGRLAVGGELEPAAEVDERVEERVDAAPAEAVPVEDRVEEATVEAPPVEEPVVAEEPVEAAAGAPHAPIEREQRAAVLALGYASVPAEGNVPEDLDEQKLIIEREAERLGAELVEVVREREPKAGRALDRAGLSYLISRIAAGDASCVVVSALDRLSRSVAELGTIVQWLERNEVRLIASDIKLDTASPGGRTTALALASVAKWEHERVSQRTRSGLAAARAKRHAAAGPDWTEVRERIATMRADGMTLQAIADVLNAEGVPTQRGGAEWRPSSVQTAAGYKRRTRPSKLEDLPTVGRQARTRSKPDSGD